MLTIGFINISLYIWRRAFMNSFANLDDSFTNSFVNSTGSFMNSTSRDAYISIRQSHFLRKQYKTCAYVFSAIFILYSFCLALCTLAILAQPCQVVFQLFNRSQIALNRKRYYLQKRFLHQAGAIL